MKVLNPEEWSSLWRGVDASNGPKAWFDRLVAAYAAPQRHYHNQQHIRECLAEFESVGYLAAKPEAVELAIWFHDVIYDPQAKDNEARSASLARECLSEARVEGELVDMVCQLIMATKDHEPGEVPDGALMIDIDLSILGKPKERFLEYEGQIRQEYAVYPDEFYRPGRAKLLERFLARERIFRTDWFFRLYEKQARENLRESIRTLSTG